MEKTKRTRIIQYLLVVAFAVTAVFAVPSTNAKYSATKTYTINIESIVRANLELVLKKNVMSSTPGSAPTAVTYKAEQAGYYIFVAKGGDGARGMKTDSNELVDNRGVGGVVSGCVYLNANETLTLYAGSNATVPTRADTNWIGRITTRHNSNPGQNGLYAAKGGNSSYLTSITTRNSSGAGGAASVILKGSGSSSTLVAVAGGGGGGGGGDDNAVSFLTQFVAVEGGKGGDGGNITPTASYNYSANGLTYRVYYGSSGSSSTNGNGGSAGNYSSPLSRSGSTWSGGNGVGGNSNSFGGGGGGGLAGGAGGKGDGNGMALFGNGQAGGGGGGSSAVVTTSSNYSTLKLKSSVLSTVLNLNNINYSTTTENGFIIIAYVVDGTTPSIQRLFSDGDF